MGFWGNIGRGLLGLGKGLLGVAPAAATIGQVAGDAAGGLRDERFREDQLGIYGDRNKLDRSQLDIGQRQGRDSHALQRAALLEKMGMDRAQFGIDSAGTRAKQAAYGDALKNVQDVNIDFKANTGALPKFNVSGGLRPSMFGATARGAGDALGRQALMALMTQSDMPAAVDVPEASPLVDLPELSQPKGSGVLEKTLGGVGLGSSILGGIGEWLKNRRGQQTPPVSGILNPDLIKNVKFG